jgi:hypothetical protein
MSWTEQEKAIYDLALKNVEANNKAIARVYLKTQKDILEKLKQFYVSVDPTWSAQYQAARLSAIFKEINQRLSLLSGLTIKQIEEAYLQQYRDVYYNYAYNLSGLYTSLTQMPFSGKFVALPFSIMSESAIMAGLSQPIGQYNFREFAGYAQRKLRADLREQLAIALSKGEGPAKLAARLKEVFGDGIARHIATARTEMLKAFSIAQNDSIKEAKEMGITFSYQWLGRDDGRERDSHRALNNTFAREFTRKGEPVFRAGASKGESPRLLKGRDQAAQNINCRCRRLNIPFEVTDEEQNGFPVINGIPSYKTYIEKYLQEKGY